MEFDVSLLERIASDNQRLSPFENYSTGAIGYEISNHISHAGVLSVAKRLLEPHSLYESNILVLGPGSTFELDEFWREGASKVIGIDNGVRTFDYRVREQSSYDFPTTPSREDKDARWNEYIERVGIPWMDLVRIFGHNVSDEKLTRQVLERTTKDEWEQEREAHSFYRFALLEIPTYTSNEGGLESEDGRVRYIEGDIQDKLGTLEEQFDLVTATSLFQLGKFGPPEQMTEHKMFVSRMLDGRMYEDADIPIVMKGVAEHLVDNGIFLVKTRNYPTFLTQDQFESHGLVAENYNTETPHGFFTILRKAA